MKERLGFLLYVEETQIKLTSPHLVCCETLSSRTCVCLPPSSFFISTLSGFVTLAENTVRSVNLKPARHHHTAGVFPVSSLESLVTLNSSKGSSFWYFGMENTKLLLRK